MALKIANLILAHKAPEQLVRLVRRLQTPDRAFVVHLDQKSKRPEWDRAAGELKEMGVLWADRVAVSWGEFSQVQAALNCMDKLRELGVSWDFVNLLSGQDYPIRPAEHLEAYLSAHQGECLMDFYPFPFPGWHFGGYNRLPTWRVPARGKPRRIIPERLARRFHRPLPLGHRPCGGSQWWCLPGEAVTYVHQFVRANPGYVEYWKRAIVPDEMFFHTILGNSHFQVRSGTNHLHYINWDDGSSPAVLGESHIHHLKTSGRFFARKFDNELQPGVLDRIDGELLGINPTDLGTTIGMLPRVQENAAAHTAAG